MAEMEGTGLVVDMSPSDQVIKFCLENNLQRGVIDELLDRGFDSLQALSLVDTEDLKSQRIPVGQRRLIIHIAKSLSSTVDQQKSQSSSSAVPTPEINTAQTPDVYQQTLMNSLLTQQAQLATGQSDVAQNLLNQPPSTDNLPGHSQPSWHNPQVHLSTATGKSTSSYLDICDFVPNAVEEELVIGVWEFGGIYIENFPFTMNFNWSHQFKLRV